MTPSPVLRGGRPYAAALLTAVLALVLTACGGGSTASGSTATDSTLPGSTAPSTTEEPSQAPSSDVSVDKSLTDWVAAVCAADKKTLNPDQLTPDPTAIAKDPQEAIKEINKTFTALPVKLNAFADELESIGAPNVPNGKEFTDTFINTARLLATDVAKANAKAKAAGGGIAGLQAFGKAMESSQVKASTEQLQKLYDQISKDTDLEAAIAADPTCKSLKKG